jgi:hypothetical protein
VDSIRVENNPNERSELIGVTLNQKQCERLWKALSPSLDNVNYIIFPTAKIIFTTKNESKKKDIILFIDEYGEIRIDKSKGGKSFYSCPNAYKLVYEVLNQMIVEPAGTGQPM